MDQSAASVASSTGSGNTAANLLVNYAGGSNVSKEEQIVQNFFSKVAQVIVQS
ncbi:hypothetical protein HK405_001072, partial [Cladochytrium tenue]